MTPESDTFYRHVLPMEQRRADSIRIVIIWGIIPKGCASDDEKPHTTFTATARIVYGPTVSQPIVRLTFKTCN